MSTEALVNIKKGIGLLVKYISLWKYIAVGFQASIMYRNPHTIYLRVRYPKIYTIDYFHYGEWSESELEKILSELGWKLPPGCNSTWRADCVLEEVKNYMFYKTINATHMEAFFSNMIRAGILEREEALNRSDVEGRISQERLSKALNILKLPNGYID